MLTKTLIIDNYDSFTYNLFQLLAELGGNPLIFKNDELSIADIEKIAPSHIIISPGPGTVERKEDFGICRELIELLISKKKPEPENTKYQIQNTKYKILNTKHQLQGTPTLGVCLGHQGIIHALGGKITRAQNAMHGKQSAVEHDGSVLFHKIKNPFQAMRYHSLCGSPENFPKELKITAWSKDDKTIMGIEHFTSPLFGVQFHPESFGTPDGKQLLMNFLNIKI